MLMSSPFRAMGCHHQVFVGDVASVDTATEICRAVIDEIDAVCSRFREDSELSALNRCAGNGPVVVSDLLWRAIAVSLDAAAATDGLVDPTVGSCLEYLDYTVTFREMASSGPALAPFAFRVMPSWRAVECDPARQTVSLPRGMHIDLGATGKAWAADVAATAAAAELGCGVMVNCGGDVACAGVPPDEGWTVGVAGDGDARTDEVRIFDGGIATSSPLSRRWSRGDRQLHHIIDPRTGLPALTPWQLVTVVASTCSGANAASTAAILRGYDALSWLNDSGLPARLVAQDGTVHTTEVWPQ